MIDTKNVEDAKKQINKSQRPIIVLAQDDNFNRKILEYGKFDVLLSPERGQKNSSVRQLDSGLNHVLAKIAKKNNISIGIDLNEIKKLPKIEKSRRLARIRQNISIMQKTKTSMKILNADPRDAFHFLLSLGASTSQAKLATS